MGNPVILIHGYSDRGESFRHWAGLLKAAGHNVHTCSYRTLTNEVTIKDIAEGFDRALRIRAGLNQDQEFDAIVHSTGMLVIRAWLATYPHRRSRLKRLIGLAPATFGSPLAHKGRSWLGSIFKGEKQFGPDFLEAGDLVLDGLELGSRFTWDLAHQDLVGGKDCYGREADTPYVFVFCGTSAYSGLRRFVNEPGTDGTVRLAGCALNVRKITMDLTVEAGHASRARFEPWSSLDVPLIPIGGLDHGTILEAPTPALVDLVASALKVDSADAFDDWRAAAMALTADTRQRTRKWQQFILRVVDERNDPVPDYYVEIFTEKGSHIRQFDLDTHAYSGDKSLRSFHVNLDEIDWEHLKSLKMRLIASSGSELVGYYGHGSERLDAAAREIRPEGKWDAVIDMTPLLIASDVRFFFPFTTTLIEIRLNREPMPPFGNNRLLEIMDFTDLPPAANDY